MLRLENCSSFCSVFPPSLLNFRRRALDPKSADRASVQCERVWKPIKKLQGGRGIFSPAATRARKAVQHAKAASLEAKPVWTVVRAGTRPAQMQMAQSAAIQFCAAGLRRPSMGGAVLLLLLRGCLRGGFPATEKHSIFGRMAGVRSAFDASADGMTASFHRLRVREDFGFHIFNRTTELSLHR